MRRSVGFVTVVLLLALAPAAGAARGKPGGNNQPPGVELTAPLDGSGFAVGDTIRLAAEAWDADGRISRVAFYRGDVLIGSRNKTPYAIDWTDAPSGTHVLTAVATDNGKASTASAAVAITVEARGDDGGGGNGGNGGDRRVVGYFTQWGIYTSGYTVRELDRSGSAAPLTHLLYAFGNVRENRCEVGVLEPVDPATGAGGDAWADYARPYSAAESVDGQADARGQALRGHWNQLRKLKARHPDLKVLISLGGWTWSHGFAEAARPENREAFVASCIDAYIHGDLPPFDGAGGAGAALGVFDGFDIDWEYPAACGLSCGGSEDSANFTALLAEFRRQLDAVSPGLVLSATVGAGVDKIRVTEPGEYQAALDFVNLMSYDFHGAWESRTNFHSALFSSPADPSSGDARFYNTHDAVEALRAAGMPAHKIVLGIASYGRGWTGVGSRDDGLYQGGTPAPGSLGAGVESYRVLSALGHPAFVDPASLGRWTYDGSTFWTYDTPASITEKTTYVQVQGLGGAFLWDFAGDDGSASLIRAIGEGLRQVP